MKKILLSIPLLLITASAVAYTNTEIKSAQFLADKSFIVNYDSQPSQYRLDDTISRKEIMKIIAKIDGGSVSETCD
jgi:hypothetical protein